MVADVEKKSKEMHSLVQAARDATATVGVAQFATRFEQVAKDHQTASRAWLVAAAVLGVLTAGLALSFLKWLAPDKPISDPGTIQFLVTKVIVISILYFCAVWSARNYRAHRHLCVVNKHRQNALSTFETFVKAAESDNQTKSAVLLEATHCIFTPSVTGYLGAEEENPSNRIIEILKTANSASG